MAVPKRPVTSTEAGPVVYGAAPSKRKALPSRRANQKAKARYEALYKKTP